ncbi:hypothetical protein NDU88_005933 [Pleurodeles waltl]|uniref:EF-hand domain-containing protein n=1 Tax=Pleurodeles waltl TaxID=8319 RepID=A0AAV7WZ46_PLEWA|nr:hypothetical protein NDU88_005933 [Pleurodeles waltl]
MVAPTYEIPNQDMLKEWAENYADSSKRMMSIIIRYADIDRSNTLKEIDTLRQEVKDHPDQELITRTEEDMMEHLKNYELFIKDRKTIKFKWGKLDYRRGHIYTFSNRFDTIRKQTLSEILQAKKQAGFRRASLSLVLTSKRTRRVVMQETLVLQRTNPQ